MARAVVQASAEEVGAREVVRFRPLGGKGHRVTIVTDRPYEALSRTAGVLLGRRVKVVDGRCVPLGGSVHAYAVISAEPVDLIMVRS